MKMNRQKLDILKKLHKKGETDVDISKKLGVTPRTVGNWRRKLGLSRNRSFVMTPEVVERFKILWKKGIPYNEISEILKVKKHTLMNYRLNNLPPRQKGNCSLHKFMLENFCLSLRKRGFTDKAIARYVSTRFGEDVDVPLAIGRAMMRGCRVDKKCPFKALLPETEV